MKINQGKYQIIKEIKTGGMGKVSLGRHTCLNEEVVIKELILSGNEVAMQFMEEAKLLYGHTSHPAIPDVKDYFIENKKHYLVMSYIKGKSMQDFLDLGKIFGEDTICWIADRILSGLAYIHRMGVFHRDIKPGNIIINLGIHRAVLVDFGIAKKKIDLPENQTGASISYTKYFASPEQYRGEKCTSTSDIYSLGATMYYALTGKLPPESISLKSDKDLTAPHLIDSSIHPQLSAVIMKAMKLNPPERFKNAEEMKNICDRVRMTHINPYWQPPK